MPSPVSELRGPNVKHHEASFLEDYTFQQASPCIRALRDPVSNRVTLVGLRQFMWVYLYFKGKFITCHLFEIDHGPGHNVLNL